MYIHILSLCPIDVCTSKMKALKCKTLGGIHMQSTAATYTSVVYNILHMRVRVPRCPLRLYLACFTPVAPVASL